MIDLLETFKNLLSEIFSNNNFLELIGILVVATTSYSVAKYSTLKPNKMKIKQLQLDNVYLPLYRVFEHLNANPSKRQIISSYNKISNILDRHYELAFPQLHKLNKELKNQILSSENCIKTLKVMERQVKMDYELLKKSLGYPSESFYNIFIRMTKKQKLEWVISWLNVFMIFGTFFLSFPMMRLFNKHPLLSTISIFISFSIILAVLMALNNAVKNMQD